MIYLSGFLLFIAMVTLVYIVGVLINPVWFVDKKTGDMPVKRNTIVDGGSLFLATSFLGISASMGFFVFLVAIFALLFIIFVATAIFKSTRSSGYNDRTSPAPSVYLRRISFAYEDKNQNLTYRTVRVLRDGGDRIHGWCESVQAERTFIKRKMTSVKNEIKL